VSWAAAQCAVQHPAGAKTHRLHNTPAPHIHTYIPTTPRQMDSFFSSQSNKWWGGGRTGGDCTNFFSPRVASDVGVCVVVRGWLELKKEKVNMKKGIEEKTKKGSEKEKKEESFLSSNQWQSSGKG
jgi:hypothetical protein